MFEKRKIMKNEVTGEVKKEVKENRERKYGQFRKERRNDGLKYMKKIKCNC